MAEREIKSFLFEEEDHSCPVKRKIWTLPEVRKVIPEIIRLSEEAYGRTRELITQLEGSILPENEQERVEEELQQLMDQWVSTVIDMGAEVKGLWLVDFDFGEGYYCWKLGEKDILFQHTYESGFSGRHPIGEEEESNYE